MTNERRSSKLVAAALMLVLLMTGCAATRSTFDVPIPQAQSTSANGFIKLTEVRDVRRFEAAPRNPSIPSLQNAAEIEDRAITSRAIARKRGGFGAALADILLPEGRTVEQLVREAVTKAVNENGYTVVDERSPEFGNALPLQIDIQQFWAWFTPGFFLLSVEFEGILVLKGEALIGSAERQVRAYGIVKGMVATDNEWQEVMRLGIADLIETVKASVKRPR
jgi:uncharacterized lipoprotein YajG